MRRRSRLRLRMMPMATSSIPSAARRWRSDLMGRRSTPRGTLLRRGRESDRSRHRYGRCLRREWPAGGLAGGAGGRAGRDDRWDRHRCGPEEDVPELVTTPWLAPPPSGPPPGYANWAPPSTVYIPETGHAVDGVFLDSWRAWGGASSWGYPLTAELPGERPHRAVLRLWSLRVPPGRPERRGCPIRRAGAAATAVRAAPGVREWQRRGERGGAGGARLGSAGRGSASGQRRGASCRRRVTRWPANSRHSGRRPANPAISATR